VTTSRAACAPGHLRMDTCACAQRLRTHSGLVSSRSGPRVRMQLRRWARGPLPRMSAHALPAGRGAGSLGTRAAACRQGPTQTRAGGAWGASPHPTGKVVRETGCGELPREPGVPEATGWGRGRGRARGGAAPPTVPSPRSWRRPRAASAVAASRKQSRAAARALEAPGHRGTCGPRRGDGWAGQLWALPRPPRPL
jgi:hypothetical protein